jgi:hypothetical protein
MKLLQRQYSSEGWRDVRLDDGFGKAQLIFAFGSKALVKQPERYQEIVNMFPEGFIVICSTAGEILDSKVFDDTISITAIEFGSSHVEAHEATIEKAEDCVIIGRHLGEQLDKEGLKHVMIFMAGIQSIVPDRVAITGGLAGDGDRFEETYVGLNSAPERNKVVVLGFYGDNLAIGHGSFGGWDAFGVSRLVTKSKDNIVYELDNKPVLDIYKEYLGDLAKGLPLSGLLFPLSVKFPDSEGLVVRTMLSVNEADKSIRFAGNIPQGSYAQLMKGNANRLIEGARKAADMSLLLQPDKTARLAILINCVGRKLVFKQRTEEEIEEVCSIFGDDCFTTGFYSYGEISPSSASGIQCQLQNQTMTITTLSENKPQNSL